VVNLKKLLKQRLNDAKKIALLAIGSDLRADDAAALLVARALKGAPRKKKHGFKIFIGETAPENLTGEIKKFKPSHVLIVDTMEMGMRPGKTFLIDPSSIGNDVSFSTHKMPVRVLADYLLSSLPGCQVLILGIQAKCLEFGAPVSLPVKRTIREVVRILRSCL
jgi:hydrogenase 3 maturation protease